MTGKIVGKDGHGGKNSRFGVTYRFPTEHGESVGTMDLSLEAWDALAIGNRVSVTYWPPYPGLSRLGRVDAGDVNQTQEREKRHLWIILAIGGMIFLGVLGIYRNERRTLIGADLYPGRIVRYEPIPGKSSPRIVYTFGPDDSGTGVVTFSNISAFPLDRQVTVVKRPRSDPKLLEELSFVRLRTDEK